MKTLVALSLVLVAGCTAPVQETTTNMTAEESIDERVIFSSMGRKTELKHGNPTKIEAGSMDRSEFTAIDGAECHLKAATFEAKVTTPTTLYLPGYGDKTPDMVVTCTKDDMQGSKAAKAVNLTKQNLNATAAAHMLVGFGLVGAIATGVQADKRDKTLDVWGYNTVKVTMK